jgi:hypothetical protein
MLLKCKIKSLVNHVPVIKMKLWMASSTKKTSMTSKITELGTKNSTHAFELIIYSGNSNVNSSKKSTSIQRKRTKKCETWYIKRNEESMLVQVEHLFENEEAGKALRAASHVNSFNSKDEGTCEPPTIETRITRRQTNSRCTAHAE